MTMYPLNELGPHVKAYDGAASHNANAPSLITAAGTGDNTKVTGRTVNRFNGTALAHSAVVATGYLAALTDTKTISLAHEIQESADNSSWDSAEAIEALTVKATSSGGTNERGVDVHDLSLTARKQYFRINVTPDLSAGATDTALFFTVVILGGWTQVPQSS